MSELKKAVYMTPRTFEKYDNGRIILYPNETVISDYTPEVPEGSDATPSKPSLAISMKARRTMADISASVLT